MKSVFIVLRNADFTEGRGPMVFDSVFDNGPAAVRYVQSKAGIYGSPQHVEMDKYGHYAYANGYLIDEHLLFSSEFEINEVQEAKEREAALKKLSKRERQLLGLN